jgi:hypothetical protein
MVRMLERVESLQRRYLAAREAHGLSRGLGMWMWRPGELAW